jgi:ubiquinol-cytochrome c reductase cytochrome c1 subunit
MIRNSFIVGLAAAVAAFVAATAAPAQEAGGTPHYPLIEPVHADWSFDGPFGSFDQQQLQRGFQVYREVCSLCHSMELVAFRNLGEEGGPGFGEAEVRALAAEYQVEDGPNDSGDMFERPGRPSDTIPPPFPNEQAARAANGGALPPDLSLIAKARAVERGLPWFLLDIFTQYQEGGPDYIYSLLTGYQEAPQGVEMQPGLNYNPYFISGAAIAMPPPLSDGQIAYAQNQDDNSFNDVPETVEQYARDVTAFLAWAAEPHLEARKRTGFSAMGFLILFAGLVYYTKRKVWAEVEH